MSGVLPMMTKPPTATAQIVKQKPFARLKADPILTWLMLCGLFGVAVVTAILVALL